LCSQSIKVTKNIDKKPYEFPPQNKKFQIYSEMGLSTLAFRALSAGVCDVLCIPGSFCKRQREEKTNTCNSYCTFYTGFPGKII
jgi:hypothetical protein